MSATPSIVLVDARNVLRSRWPNMPEEEVASRTAVWAEAHGMEAVAVFDGSAPAGAGAVGTGSESADDWIIRRAAELAAEGRAYWLVTSDRALREAAGRAAERTIGGGSFLRELERQADCSRAS